MDEYIGREAAKKELLSWALLVRNPGYMKRDDAMYLLDHIPAADVAPVVHGRWILEAHYERVNYRCNVTAECSECCDEQKEIWVGFFPNVPPSIARDVALVSAESVKLSNYCPNCGARMDGDDNG